VALEQGLGELLVDYVVEVCGDPFLTSADPVEAYLMDGRCVQQWAHRALHRSRARFLQVRRNAGFTRVEVLPRLMHRSAFSGVRAPCWSYAAAHM